MTAKELGDQPAFPQLHNTCQVKGESEYFEGLTKLELFTALAMVGCVANPLCDADVTYERVSNNALAQAKAQLEALAKEMT